MRAFIAIELPSQIKDYLSRLQTKLKTTQADVKWVDAQQIHLTLKFLGEIDNNTKDKMISVLTELSGSFTGFQAGLDVLGGFPNLETCRILWVGLHTNNQQLQTMAHWLEDKLAQIGIARETRAFKSHVTLGRVRSSRNRKVLVQEALKLKDHPQKNTQSFPITHITLFQSTLTPTGPIYTPLFKATLQP